VKAWQKELKVWHKTQICQQKILSKCNKWDRIQDHPAWVHPLDIHNIEALLQDKDNQEGDHHQEVQECKVSIVIF
jgi:hypothetical protein